MCQWVWSSLVWGQGRHCCGLIVAGPSLWVFCCKSVFVVRSLWVGCYGMAVVGRSLWFDRCGLVAMGWSLWFGRCRSIAVIQLRVGLVALGWSLLSCGIPFPENAKWLTNSSLSSVFHLTAYLIAAGVTFRTAQLLFWLCPMLLQFVCPMLTPSSRDFVWRTRIDIVVLTVFSMPHCNSLLAGCPATENFGEMRSSGGLSPKRRA